MKNIQRSFLLWWAQIVSLAFVCIIVNHFGWWTDLYELDKTKISFGILALFTIASAAIGVNSYFNTKQFYQRTEEYLWFSTDIMISMGLIGTVAGFMMMFGDAFSGLDVSDTANVQKAIAEMGMGMSTALLTTLVGLVCSNLTKTQLVILENNLTQDQHIEK